MLISAVNNMCADLFSRDVPSLPPAVDRALRVAEAQEILHRRIRVSAIRLEAAANLEEAHLTLATALLLVKGNLGCSWKGLASLLGEVVEYTHLFKVGARGTYMKKKTFDIVRRSLIRLAYEELGINVHITTWKDPIESDESE